MKNNDATASVNVSPEKNDKIDIDSINFQVIANVVGCSNENIHNFFNKLQEKISQTCKNN